MSVEDKNQVNLSLEEKSLFCPDLFLQRTECCGSGTFLTGTGSDAQKFRDPKIRVRITSNICCKHKTIC